MPAAGFGCIHSRTTGSVEETFSLRYHDGAVAGGEATFRPCRYDGCVLSRWSTSGSDDPLEPSRLARSLARLHNAIFYSASVPVTARRLRWEKQCALFRFRGRKIRIKIWNSTRCYVHLGAPVFSGFAQKWSRCKVTCRISSKVFEPDVRRRCALHS